jgi:hypothetical protein
MLRQNLLAGRDHSIRSWGAAQASVNRAERAGDLVMSAKRTALEQPPHQQNAD